MDDWRYPHDLGTLSHHPFFLGIFHLFMKPTSYSQKTCPNFAGTPKWFINLFWTGQIKIVTWLKIRIQLSTRYFAVNPGIINPERRFKWGKIRGPDFFPPILGFPILSIFLVICSILEQEGALSTIFFEFEPLISSNFAWICNMLMLFAAFWSWKLPCQRYLQHFWVRTFHFP